MAIFSKGRGLFGAPMYQTPGFGDGAASPDAAPIQREATIPTYKKPSTAQFIAGTVGDALQNWSGGKGTFLPGLQRQQELGQQQALYNQRRADDYTDWERKQQYAAANPGPVKDDTFTSTLRAAGIDPASAQGMALYRQRAATLAAPAPNFVSDGAGGGRWVQPPAMGLGAPTAPIGKLTPLGAGGATPQGARPFR